MRTLLLWLCCGLPLCAQFDEPFAASPAALLQAAKAIPGDEPAVILMDDHRYTFDVQGRLTRTVRQIVFLRKAAAVEDWTQVSAPWNPWQEEKPRLAARVISATAELHRLDPATTAEAPVQEFDSSIFSDQRILRAPLPAVKEGAVIEWQSTTRETAPLFSAGVSFNIPIGGALPIQRTRVAVDSDIPLRHIANLVEPQVSQEGKRTRLRLDLGPRPQLDGGEAFAPREKPTQPYLAFSTGTSWQAIAARYGEMVDEQLRGANLSAFLQGIQAPSREGKIAAILQRIRDQVRYTGVEFGEAAIIPRAPAEVLSRKYGDCKDKAALLVAALRAAEIPAHLALLNVNTSPDTNTGLPGFLFNHAIVYVPGPKALWIDVTDDASRLGDVPLADQGRLALIASPETTALVEIPQAGADHNQLRITRKILMRGSSADVTETLEGQGHFETALRQRFRGKQGDDLNQAFSAEAKSATKVADDDYSRPFQAQAQVASQTRALVSVNEAAVVLAVDDLFSELPFMLLSPNEPKEPRKSSLVLPLSYTAEIRTEITPPAGFRVRPLPKSEQRQLGALRWTVEYQTLPDGRISTLQRLAVPQRRLTPEEVAATRAAIAKFDKEPVPILQMLHTAQEQMAAGQWKEALAGLRQAALAEPEAFVHQARLAQAYLTIGAGGPARTAARKAAQLDPKSADTQVLLGNVLEHDLIGRRRLPGWEPKEAEAAYRLALKLDAKHDAAHLALATLLEHNAQGDRFGSGARLDEALAEYDLVTGPSRSQAMLDRALALYYGNKLADFATAAQMPGMPAALAILATAAQESAAAAIVEAQQKFSGSRERAQILWTASYYLLAARRYAPAVDLARAGARLFPETTRQADVFAEFFARAGTSPEGSEGVAGQWRAAIIEETSDAVLSPLLSRHFRLAEARQAIERLRATLNRVEGGASSMLAQIGATRAFVADFALGAPATGKEGDDATGYRIGGQRAQAIFVVREDGRYKLLGTAGDLSGVGRAVLREIQAGHLEQARRWLDWTVDLPARAIEDTGIAPVRVVWSGTTELARNAEAARLAAAVLILRDSPEDNEAIALLEAGRAAEKVPALRSPYEQALAEARLARGEYQAVLPLATALEARFPTQSTGYRLKLQALIALKNWPQLALAVAAQKARATPPTVGRVRVLEPSPDKLSILAMAQAAAVQQQWAKAAELVQPLCAAEFPDHEELIACAWSNFAAGKLEPKLREPLTKFEYQGRLALAAATQATLAGDYSEAATQLQRSIAARSLPAPDAVTWFVHARILQGLGLTAEAKEALQRVTIPKRPLFDWAETVAASLAAR
ncbi:MAG: DUF3857 domain-containing protein [Bryobacteraceae bacterium]|nr:DUF3857 domain-containing protein [Bryobacteraceae bacterium]